MAAKRCDALLELGDAEGRRVWKGVLRALEELVRVARARRRLNQIWRPLPSVLARFRHIRCERSQTTSSGVSLRKAPSTRSAMARLPASLYYTKLSPNLLWIRLAASEW